MQTSWRGRVSYEIGLSLQQSAWLRACESSKGEILGLEHEPVITLGKRSNPALDLLVSEASLSRQNLSVRYVDRGGEATLHSPGQLVIYPILNLREMKIGVREFVQLLIDTTIQTLACYGLSAVSGQREPGIFVNHQKIAFFGIRVRNGVSQHGLSINVSNDLSLFKTIRSCGAIDQRFTSLNTLGLRPEVKEVFEVWSQLVTAPVDNR